MKQNTTSTVDSSAALSSQAGSSQAGSSQPAFAAQAPSVLAGRAALSRRARPSDPIAQRVIAALDTGADRLPYRISHRLQLATQAALAAHGNALAQTSSALAPAWRLAGAGQSGGPSDRPSLPWRLTLTLLPIAAVIAGFLAIADIGDALEADETADIDEAVLIDEVPISAYADHGFGVFLKNNRP